MARELANIRLDIWTSQEFRDLSETEQRLYFLLLSHDSLSYAGVADWRPKRLARFSSSSTAESIDATGRELESKRFLLIDDDTEEVLIRSFLKHDGLLKQPRLTVSMVNAYGAATSEKIRAVIIHELTKLVQAGHDWAGLKHERTRNLLSEHAAPIEDFISPKSRATFGSNGGQGLGLHTGANFHPSDDRRLGLHTATATSTPSKEGGAGETKKPKASKEKPFPDDFQVTDSHRKKASEYEVDVEWQRIKFEDHHRSKDSRFKDWSRAFHTWLNNAVEFQQERGGNVTPLRRHPDAPDNRTVFEMSTEEFEERQRRHRERLQERRDAAGGG